MKHKALVVIGTRPEAIKMAPVIRALKADPAFDCKVCSTGQHQEMLYPILDWFDIQTDFRLNVMTHGQPLAHLVGRILNGMQTILENHRPDTIFVHGDTTTAFASALAAHCNYDFATKKPIHIAHVEAGLRTYNTYAPYPEESNRRQIGHLAHWHFAPTETAAEALLAENITERVHITGNTVIDALFDTLDILREKPRNPLPQVPQDAKIILVTAHRRENYGDGFKNICHALKDLAVKYKNDNVHIVYPVHLNPIVKNTVAEIIPQTENIHLIRPMDYPDFVAAMARSHLVITDSGGLQEEAPSLGKPVLVLRDVTERPDAVKAGTVRLIGTDYDRIMLETCRLLDSEEAYNKMAQATNPYGDGRTSERIVNLVKGKPALANTYLQGISA